VKPDPVFETECTEHCKSLFSTKGCVGVVDAEYYTNACIEDTKATGDFSMAEAMKIKYMAECNTSTDLMEKDCNEEVVKKAVQVREECGLGDNKCIKDCSNNGVCGPNGCVCKGTWGGIDCSVDMPKKLSYDVKTETYATGSTQEYNAATGNIVSADKKIDDTIVNGETKDSAVYDTQVDAAYGEKEEGYGAQETVGLLNSSNAIYVSSLAAAIGAFVLFMAN
jgi:hypothetical protein